MAELVIPVYSQEGLDSGGRLQSQQWAVLPAELSIAYLSGGLKKMRRMIESYFGYRFSPASKRVRGVWRGGEPHLRLRCFRLPYVHGRTLVHLGRLRSAATSDILRGYLEILGGEMVDPEAIASPRPWPEDMPWVAPSAGEFDVQREQERPPYLGTFEIRVQRTADGCTLHTILQDFPPVRKGLRARLWNRPWQPLRSASNLDFLRSRIALTAREARHEVRCEIRELPGLPERLHAIDAPQHLSPA